LFSREVFSWPDFCFAPGGSDDDASEPDPACGFSGLSCDPRGPLARINPEGLMQSDKKHSAAPLRSVAANENVVPLRPRALARRKALLRAAQGRKTAVAPEIVEGLAAALDAVFVLAAAAAALAAYEFFVLGYAVASDQYMLAAVCGGAGFVSLMHRARAYGLKRLTALRWQSARILAAWTTVVAALLVIAFITKTSLSYSRLWVLMWMGLTPGLVVAGRAATAALLRRWREGGYLRRHVAIVGANAMSAALIEKLTGNPYEGVSIVGIFDDRRDRVPNEVAGYDVLGTTDDLVDFARAAPIDEVIVALPQATAPRLTFLFKKLRLLPVDLRLSAEPLLEEFPIRGVTTVGEATLLEFVERPLKNWRAVAKWLEDKIVAVAALVLAGPLMALVALLIKLDSPGPVFFVQERYGYNNAVIRVLKFRTMIAGRQDPTGGARTCRGDPRVTRLGRFLRMSSLDELPQLWNVLKGDMSIVGPRPHPLAMKAGERLYHEAVADYARRHRIKPGMTGWAQVCGLRGEIDSVEKGKRRVELDLFYIDNWSLAFDLYVMLRSVGVVLDTRGAY
jgi:polysaccharide biosynthesis protein PslA